MMTMMMPVPVSCLRSRFRSPVYAPLYVLASGVYHVTLASSVSCGAKPCSFPCRKDSPIHAARRTRFAHRIFLHGFKPRHHSSNICLLCVYNQSHVVEKLAASLQNFSVIAQQNMHCISSKLPNLSITLGLPLFFYLGCTCLRMPNTRTPAREVTDYCGTSSGRHYTPIFVLLNGLQSLH